MSSRSTFSGYKKQVYIATTFLTRYLWFYNTLQSERKSEMKML